MDVKTRLSGCNKVGCRIPVECVLRLCFALCRLHLNILHMRKVEHQRRRQQTLCCSLQPSGFRPWISLYPHTAAELLIPKLECFKMEL